MEGKEEKAFLFLEGNSGYSKKSPRARVDVRLTFRYFLLFIQ